MDRDILDRFYLKSVVFSYVSNDRFINHDDHINTVKTWISNTLHMINSLHNDASGSWTNPPTTPSFRPASKQLKTVNDMNKNLTRTGKHS